MSFFKLFTPISYWLLTVLWLFIFLFYVHRIVKKRLDSGLFVTLLTILAIDAFRTLFESIYFGAWYTSLVGFIPKSVHDFLVRPECVFIPKSINVIAAILIIFIVLRRWIPQEEAEREKEAAYLRELENEILERIQAEKLLQDSELKFRALSDASFEGIVITEKGKILEVNERVSTLFGYSVSELITMSATDLVVPDMREDVRNKILSAYEKPYEVKCIKKNGSVFDVEVNAKMFTYRGKMVRVASLKDISDQKRAEEEIKYLRGILPLCSFCKKIRDDKGYWEQVDIYIYKHSQAEISHSICPLCLKEHYPEFASES